MKIAICFSGQNRTGHLTSTNILRYIGDLLPECDVFTHFWDSETKGTGYANRLGAVSTDAEYHTAELTDADKNVEFYRAYRPRTMMVEQYDLQETKSTWGGRRYDPVEDKWHVSMWRSLYEANKLKMDYARKNQIFYDYTVRIRSDIVFWIGPTLLMDNISSYYATYTNTVSNINDPHQPGYQDWQWHSAEWIHGKLGYTFEPLANTKMRIYTQQDVDSDIDPLNPGFGPDNRPGAFENKNV